ncbi:hypothetical protein SAMN04487974_1044 [Pelagibacterium luteolum]|uniref:Uncharacterized protein n=1 Tax=Pelagibacterium luteolum TaxID=440168 RepID=A0A1G7VA92_9HYPH|nr:hypothetical protein SAMN04487974_1044 [Pelagibacterium luteolum]
MSRCRGQSAVSGAPSLFETANTICRKFALSDRTVQRMRAANDEHALFTDDDAANTEVQLGHTGGQVGVEDSSDDHIGTAQKNTINGPYRSIRPLGRFSTRQWAWRSTSLKTDPSSCSAGRASSCTNTAAEKLTYSRVAPPLPRRAQAAIRSAKPRVLRTASMKAFSRSSRSASFAMA